MGDSDSEYVDNQIDFFDFSDDFNQNLDLEYIFKRVRKFGEENSKPFFTSLKRGKNKHKFIAAFEGPTFGRLWECCWVLQRLVKTGCTRKVKLESKDGDCHDDCICEECVISGQKMLAREIQRDSVTAFSDYLSSYVLDLPAYWFTWADNTFSGYLQKLVPTTLPPLIWKKTTSYLMADLMWNNGFDSSSIATISKTEKVQVLEKSLVQECVLLCSELVKMFGLILYTSHSHDNIKYLSASITKTMQLFSTAMMRLDSLLNPETTSSKVLNMCMKNESSGTVEDVVNAFNSHSQDCLFYVLSFISANDEFENNSPYFVWLEKGSNSKKIYRLIYAKKRVLASSDRKDIIKMGSPGNVIDIFSEDRPAIHCSESIVAVVTNEETGEGKQRWFLWVWDLEVSSRKEMFKYKLDRLTAVYNKRGMATGGISAVGNVGMSKKGSLISIVVSIRFKLVGKDNRAVCSFVLTFDTKSFGGEKSDPKPKTMLADSMSIGVHKKYVFSIRIGVDPMLILQDLDKNLKPLTMVEWNRDNPWEVRFNCNPDRNTCILSAKTKYKFGNWTTI
ncbi:hypothetical protein ACHWQZ_G007763 [Mnemiopsis leidyi]